MIARVAQKGTQLRVKVRAGLKRRAQRRELLAAFPRSSAGAEIGVWKGDHAAEVLRVCKPAVLYLIDPWRHQQTAHYAGALYGGIADGQEELDQVYESVVRRFRRKPVVVKRMPSEQAAAMFAPASLNWIYIDGDHRYEAVVEDLERFAPVVCPGGFIAGDDYGITGWWGDGVTRAVDEFAAKHACRDFRVVGTQFLIRLPC